MLGFGGFRSLDDLDGQRMEPLVNEILECIIHKAVAGDTAFAGKGRAGDPHPKMAAKALRVGACMPCMRGTFVNNLQK